MTRSAVLASFNTGEVSAVKRRQLGDLSQFVNMNPFRCIVETVHRKERKPTRTVCTPCIMCVQYVGGLS